MIIFYVSKLGIERVADHKEISLGVRHEIQLLPSRKVVRVGEG